MVQIFYISTISSLHIGISIVYNVVRVFGNRTSGVNREEITMKHTKKDLPSALQALELAVQDLNDDEFLDRCTCIDKEAYKRVQTTFVALHAQIVVDIVRDIYTNDVK